MADGSSVPDSTEIGYVNPGDKDFYTHMQDWGLVPELRWPESLRTFDRMRTSDPQVIMVLKAVSLPIRGTTWRLDPNGARDEVVDFIAEQLDLPVIGKEGQKKTSRRMRRFSWSEHLRMALLMLPFGAMNFEQVVEALPDGKWGLRKLAPRMPSTLESINVARDGGLISIEQRPPVSPTGHRASSPRRTLEIPVERLVVYAHEREGGNWAGESLLHGAYKPWAIKEVLLKIWVNAIERNSMGVPWLENAPGTDGAQIEKNLKIVQGFRAGKTSAMSVPNGAKLYLQGVNGQLLDPQKAINYCDSQIGKTALAQFLNHEEGGSYALSAVEGNAFTESLTATAKTIADTTTQHVVADLVDWNWGADEPIPLVTFDDLRSNTQDIANAIRTLADAKIIRPDRSLEEWVRRDLGAPAKDTPPPEEPWTPETPGEEDDRAPGSQEVISDE